MILLFLVLRTTLQSKTLFYYTFTSTNFDTDGWNMSLSQGSNTQYICSTTNLYGGYQILSQKSIITKFFTLPPHSQVEIGFNFWKIDDWNSNDQFFFQVDGTVIHKSGFPNGNPINHCGSSSVNDEFINVRQQINHNSNTLFLMIYSTLSNNNGYWGISDFSIFIYPCPTGCVICELGETIQLCSSWALAYQSLTETKLKDFAYNDWEIFNGEQGSSLCQIPILGGFNKCGKGTNISKSISLPAHSIIKIQFRYFIVDTWDNEIGQLYEDNNLIWQKHYQGPSYPISLCGLDQFDYGDVIQIQFVHFKQNLNLRFTSNLDQPFWDESFGLRDVQVFIQCLFGYKCTQVCGDSLTQKTEECDDGNNIPFDGCHNCQYSCVQGCNNCIKGYCYDCLDGWYFIENTQICEFQLIFQIQRQSFSLLETYCIDNCKVCQPNTCLQCSPGYILIIGLCQSENYEIPVEKECDVECQSCKLGVCQKCTESLVLQNYQCTSICGDLIVSQGYEECDDGNSIPYDGCYNCNYQCTYGCVKCNLGVCEDICDYGYYLINNQCETYCGDSIVAGSEQCDDANDVNYDGCSSCQFSCPQYCLNCYQGICDTCFINYHLNSAQNICSSKCGDGIMAKGFEECDDGNLLSGDGCSQKCTIENNWICENGSECINEEYPRFNINYLNQTDQYQFVQIYFTQQVRRIIDDGLNYENFINLQLQLPDDVPYNLTIIEISKANQFLNWVIYQVQILIESNIDKAPILKFELQETLYNENGAPLFNSNNQIQLKLPQYMSNEEFNLAAALLSTHKKNLYSLGAVGIVLLITGSGIAFWAALEIFQEISYLKYINVIFPQNLMMFFESYQLISFKEIQNLLKLNKIFSYFCFENRGTADKFEFYQADGNIGNNVQSIVICLLFYLSYKFTVHHTFRYLKGSTYCQDNFIVGKMLHSIRMQLYRIKIESYQRIIKKLILANTWDLFFMIFLQFQYGQSNLILNLLTLYLLLTSLSMIIKKILQPQGRKIYFYFWNNKLLSIHMMKKLLFMLVLVFLQKNPINQVLIFILINSFHFICVVQLSKTQKSIDFKKSLITEFLILVQIFSMLFYLEEQVIYITQAQKIKLGWLNIAIFFIIGVGHLGCDGIVLIQRCIKIIQVIHKQCVNKPQEVSNTKMNILN